MEFTRKLDVPADYPAKTVVTVNSKGQPLSYICDLVWDFGAMQATGNGKPARVSFTDIPEQYRRQIQTTIYEFMQQEKAKNNKYPTYAQLKSYRWGLGFIAEFLESTNWALLSDDKIWEKFKRALKASVLKDRLSIGFYNNILSTINKLNWMQRCDRLIKRRDLGCSNLFGESKQAIAIPLTMYSNLLRNAIATLEKYHPHRHAISRVMNEAFQLVDITRVRAVADNCSAKAIEGRVTNAIQSIPHDIPDFKVRIDGAELNKIQLSCAMVVLAFSGARIGELLSFSKESYQIKEEVPVLQGETTKGMGGRPKFETWQTHPIAQDALELAHDMVAFLRPFYRKKMNKMQLEGSSLSKSLKEINSTFLTIRPERILTSFVSVNLSPKLGQYFKDSVIASAEDVEEFNRLNPSRSGELIEGRGLPRLSSHDFRRTFAVFFKRYGFGSSNTIKFQYKHTNIQMSDYYANNARLQAMEDILMDNDLLKLMHEEGILMGVSAFYEIYNESAVLSGAEGKRIAEDKFKKLRGGHQVYITRDEIESLVRNGTLSVVKLPTGGYCTNSECSRLCGLQEFASDKKPCSHKVVTDNEAKIILRQNKRLMATFRGLNIGDSLNHSMLVGLKQKIQLNELTLKEHNINFEPFTDKVQGLNKMEVA